MFEKSPPTNIKGSHQDLLADESTLVYESASEAHLEDAIFPIPLDIGWSKSVPVAQDLPFLRKELFQKQFCLHQALFSKDY
jgi:hypothetical protein